MLETYQAYGHLRRRRRVIRSLVQTVAQKALGTLTPAMPDGSTYDLSGEWTSLDVPCRCRRRCREIVPQHDVDGGRAGHHRRRVAQDRRRRGGWLSVGQGYGHGKPSKSRGSTRGVQARRAGLRPRLPGGDRRWCARIAASPASSRSGIYTRGFELATATLSWSIRSSSVSDLWIKRVWPRPGTMRRWCSTRSSPRWSTACPRRRAPAWALTVC